MQTQIDSSGNATGKYYFDHPDYYACYYCIVNNSGSDIGTLTPTDANYSKKLEAYYNALAREKYNLIKLSSYVNGSNKMETKAPEESEPRPVETYTITFNNASGLGGTTTLSGIFAGGTLHSITVPMRTGYVFEGYYERENGAGRKWYNNNGTPAIPTYDIDHNITLYAYWTEEDDGRIINPVRPPDAGIDDPVRPPLVTE